MKWKEKAEGFPRRRLGRQRAPGRAGLGSEGGPLRGEKQRLVIQSLLGQGSQSLSLTFGSDSTATMGVEV